MSQLPDAFGISVTVDDMPGATHFYGDLYPHDSITQGEFAGIPYVAIMRDGETLVNIFQKGPGNPLAPMIPVLKVGSVASETARVKDLGGQVLLDASICPCTGSPFAVCVDVSGNQFMVKQPRQV